MNYLIKRAVPCVKWWPGKPLPQMSGRRPVRNQTRSRSSGPGPKWCGGQKIYTQPPGSQSTLVNSCLTDEGRQKQERQWWDWGGFEISPKEVISACWEKLKDKKIRLTFRDFRFLLNATWKQTHTHTQTKEKCIHGVQNVRSPKDNEYKMEEILRNSNQRVVLPQ